MAKDRPTRPLAPPAPPAPRAPRARGARLARGGFTLIELLVVIAIIALLVGILLPALANARNNARRVASISNISQQSKAANSYRNDYAGSMPWPMAVWGGPPVSPIMFTGPTGMRTLNPGVPIIAYSMWSHAGKTPSQALPTQDIPDGARVLNTYIVAADMQLSTLLPTAGDRTRELPIFRSPGDKGCIFDPATLAPRPATATQAEFRNEPGRPAYDVLGTSYLNPQWWFRLVQLGTPAPNVAAGESAVQTSLGYYFYLDRLARFYGNRLDSTVNASEFAYVTDQTAVQYTWNRQPQLTSPPANRVTSYVSEFGDRDRSVMGFMDGSANYTTIKRQAPPTNLLLANPATVGYWDSGIEGPGYRLYIPAR